MTELFDNTICLTAFAAAGDEFAAAGIQENLQRRLRPYGRVAKPLPPKRYWKIPEYWEILTEIRPKGLLPDVFDRILAELGIGWNVRRFAGSGSWAVWNAGLSSTFVVPHVRWVHVECLRATTDAESQETDEAV